SASSLRVPSSLQLELQLVQRRRFQQSKLKHFSLANLHACKIIPVRRPLYNRCVTFHRYSFVRELTFRLQVFFQIVIHIVIFKIRNSRSIRRRYRLAFAIIKTSSPISTTTVLSDDAIFFVQLILPSVPRPYPSLIFKIKHTIASQFDTSARNTFKANRFTYFFRKLSFQ